MKARYEHFGGILRIEDPPATIYVDKNYMKNLGFINSELWEKDGGILSAPLDVHFALTNECPLECKHCYKASEKSKQSELTLSEIKAIIDVLSEMKVFSVAFGGGEPFARKEIFEIAAYAREKGIEPNITTNGYYIDQETAKKCKVFGHIHVSLDLPSEEFDLEKNKGAFTAAANAIDQLVKQGVHVGINCVLTKKNYDKLDELVSFCVKKGIKDFSFLRFKPIGRANKHYFDLRLTNEQNINLYKKLMKLRRKYKISIQVDCSMVPFFAYHKLNPKQMDFFGVQGCVGGEVFIEITETGKVRSCSFARMTDEKAVGLKEQWQISEQLQYYRTVIDEIEEPCKSCKYLSICRGGCHVVSEFLTSEYKKPDPECPLVVKHQGK